MAYRRRLHKFEVAVRWRARATRENVWSEVREDKEIFSVVARIET